MRILVLLLLPFCLFGQIKPSDNKEKLVGRVVRNIGVPTPTASITFFGVATNPADNAGSTATTIAVTPPASMLSGDLVVVFLIQRGTATITQNATGGQTWTALAAAYTVPNTGNTLRLRAFWCQFNGTWDANPSWDFTAGNATAAQMLVFRPSSPSKTWAVSNAIANASQTSDPIVITGYTPSQNNTVTVAQWASNFVNTWGGLSGSGWVDTGLNAQYRVDNAGGIDLSATYAYQIQKIAEPLNNVSKVETPTGTAGTSIVTFYEF